MESQDSNPFAKAKPEEVKRWYQWMAGLKRKGKGATVTEWIDNWDLAQTDNDIFWLIGFIAGTTPLGKPAQPKQAIAIVRRSLGSTRYLDGTRDGDVFPPDDIIQRKLKKDEIGNKMIYVPGNTEFSFKGKYPVITKPMKDLAKEIIDHENPKKVPALSPPAFVELNGRSIVGSGLKPYAVTDSIDSITFNDDNIFMLPGGTGAAGFYDYVVIIEPKQLVEKENILRFGVNGRYFSYAVEYSIV